MKRRVPLPRRAACKRCGVPHYLDDLDQNKFCMVCQKQEALPGLENLK